MTVLGEILVEHGKEIGKEIGIAEGRTQGIAEGRTQGIERSSSTIWKKTFRVTGS